MRLPKEGDRIVHKRHDGDRAGVVDHVMSAQFAYIDDAGHRHYCLFSDVWKVEEKDHV